jgi:hypothetical protein
LERQEGRRRRGASPEKSSFYRLDVTTRQLVPLSLPEGAASNLESPACVERGDYRDIRYGLIPAAPGKDGDGYFTCNFDRVEVRRTRRGKVVKTLEKVVGTCTYNETARDYRCPKLPADAGA